MVLSTSTAAGFEVAITWTPVLDPVRAQRLATLLFSGSTGPSTGGAA